MKSMPREVSVVAQLQAKAGREQEVLHELVALVEPTRKEEGCLQYDLHVFLDAPGRFLFYERWASRAHLERHAGSPHIQALRAKSRDLLAAPAEITVWKRLDDAGV